MCQKEVRDMSRIFIFLLIALLSVSCSKQDDETNTINTQLSQNDIEEDKELFSNEQLSNVSNKAYSNRKLYVSYGVRNGRMAWRISEKGGYFGKSPTFVFSSGRRYTIPNSSNNYRPGDGFVFKPGYNKPCTSKECDTSTSHGGVYLQAANGDRSTKVYVYY